VQKRTSLLGRSRYSRKVPPPLVLDVPNNDAARKLIPGAYEQNTLTLRQPGAMGGPPFGSAHLSVGSSTMSPATIAERQKEGGGDISQRKRSEGGLVNISNR
jgi:hypothetical protein